jgi:AraC-like DNA-binding protein
VRGWHSGGVLRADQLLTEIRDQVAVRAGRGPRTAIEGILLSRHETSEPDYQVSEPLFILMAQGGKRLYVGNEVIEYLAGDCLIVTAAVPLSGHFIAASPRCPALAVALRLRPGPVAALVSELPDPRRLRATDERGVAAYAADVRLLDAVARLLGLLDRPDDLHVLAPMVEREILWRLLTGPLGATIAQIGLADSSLAHVSLAINRLRNNFTMPISISELARTARMSPSSFHRHFRAITGLTPLQYQKHLRLQEARSLLAARTQDVASVALSVGYHSPTQFNREYRKLFGAPPGRDAAMLRSRALSTDGHR